MGTLRLIRAKLQATTIFSGGALRDLARRDQLWILPLAFVGVAVGVGTLVFSLLGNYRMLYQLGAAAGTPEILFSFAALASWALVFLLGIPVVVSVFFFSKDTAMLLPLPIRPLSIVIANAFLVYLSALALEAVVMAPALAVYGAATPVGPWFFVSALILLLVCPLLPVAVCLLLAFGLTAVVNLSRYRTLLEVAGFLVVLVGVIGVQVYLQRSVMQQVTGGLALPDALAARLLAVPRSFLPLEWVARSVVLPGGPGALSLFVLASAAAAAAAGAVAGKLFLPLTVERAVTRARRLSAGRYRTLRASRSPVAALFGREVSVIASNSSTLFEGVVEGLVFPMILVIFSFTLPAEAKELLAGFVSAPWAPLAVFGVLALMSGVNTVSSTSISREGRTFALSLMLPVPGRVQLRAKLLLHLAVFATGYVIDFVLVFAVFRFPPVHLLYFVPGGAGFLLLSFCSSILLDLRRPYLTWTHPQQAMKQNMNAMAALGVALVLVGTLAAAAVGAWALGMPPLGVGAVVAVLSVAGAAVAYPAVARYADKRYAGELEALTR